MSEEEFPLYFSEWIKHRRQELDLTQDQLARRASCSVFAIRKIEMGDRRPSVQLAELLAKSLEIPPENRIAFIKAARGDLSVDCLRSILPSRNSQLAAPSAPQTGNLPRAMTPFIGREPELAALDLLLQDPQCSLLTIVGTGGVGKTRLAIEAAQHSKDRFPDGAWFIPLVSLISPSLIIPTIAEAIHFKFQDTANLGTQLIRYLRSKKALLVLDNAEHLLEGVGVFSDILKECQQIKVLVTSRERLNLLSEWVFEIKGLPVPPNDEVEQFEAHSAVALFLQTARRAQSIFEIRDADRKWVLQICQILEGMPLGIELSAAWVGLLSCEGIAKEIQYNLDFLSFSMRDLPERHRSLRATLDHSWNLLDDEEKLILRQLSVFHGSFSREAAQEICGGSLAVLSSLRNKSLLQRTDQNDFALHEMIRQYAGLKLAEQPDENEQVNDRHAAYYIQCLANWEKALQSSRQLETFNEMARVIDNLSQAWRYKITHCRPGTRNGDPFCADVLHQALFSISLFYEQRCRSLEAISLFTESVEYMQTVQEEFDHTEDSFPFTKILGHITAYLGLHHIYIDDKEKTLIHLKEAIRLLDHEQSKVEKAEVQIMLATVYATQGNINEAATLIKQSREVFRENGVKWWYALSTIHLATSYVNLGKLQESEALFQEALQLVEPGDLRSELPLRNGFAYVLTLKGDYDKAEQWLRENLQLCDMFGNFRYTASTLFDLGRVALAMQRIDLAIEYMQKSINLLTEYGDLRDLSLHRIYLGKCFAARCDFPAALDQFLQVINIKQEANKYYQVIYGLVNIGRVYLTEGQPDKAFEIALLLKYCPTGYKKINDELNQLIVDSQAVLSKEQVESVMKQVDIGLSPEREGADALSYALELVSE